MDRYETYIIGFLRSAIENAVDGVECHISAVTIQGAIDLLKEKPQIVRCKDCKYCETCDDEEYAEPLIFDGLIWCNIHEFSRKPDYYCGDAERKDGEQNG